MSADDNDFYARIAHELGTPQQRPFEHSDEALADVVHSAVRHIPGVDYAGITVVSRRGHDVTTPAATHDHPRTLDALQQQHRQGPCFDAALEHQTFFVDDLTVDSRWPLFRRDALARTPVQAISSYQLFTTRDRVGALNLYADRRGALDQPARDLGFIFASHAAIVWTGLHRSEQFNNHLAGREVIGQATGMIMQREGFDAILATAYLRLIADNRNITLVDAAHTVLDGQYGRNR